MRGPDRPAVKICGLRRREDVLLADALGADYLGVVLSPGFHRSVDPSEAPDLLAGVAAVRVAVLVDQGVTESAARGERMGAGVLQLHGAEPPEVVRELASGPWEVWKAVRARSPEDVERAADLYGPWVRGILVEGYREGVAGGGGAALPTDPAWDVRRGIPAHARFILAGGLTPATLAGAMARWSPDVVDVSSGVEVERGRKDPGLLRSFFHAARGGVPPALESNDTGGATT